MIRLHWHLTLLTFASAPIAQEIESLIPLEEITQLTFHPQARLIDEQAANSFVRELVEKGYTPRVEEPPKNRQITPPSTHRTKEP